MCVYLGEGHFLITLVELSPVSDPGFDIDGHIVVSIGWFDDDVPVRGLFGVNCPTHLGSRTRCFSSPVE